MALHTRHTMTEPKQTVAQICAKSGWGPRQELNMWLENYRIDPDGLVRDEQLALMVMFRRYWDEWFETPVSPNPQTSTTLGEFTILLGRLAR